MSGLGWESIVLKFVANLSIMYTEIELLSRFSAASQDGFDGVEFQFPFAHSADELALAARNADSQTVVFNFPAGDMDHGDRGIAIFPERLDECRAAIEDTLIYADTLNCPRLHLMSGVLAAETQRATATQTYIDNLRYAADRFAEQEGIILVEPLNPFTVPGYLVGTLEQAFSIIQQTDRPNVRLQFDFYHCQMTQGRVEESFEKYLDVIDHVQIAGVPGRHEPTACELDYNHIFNRIEALGYSGFVGCEYHPSSTASEGIGWLHDYRTARK